MSEIAVHLGDSRDVLKTLADNSIDSVVTDPPYALVSIQKRFGKPGSAPAKGNDAYMRASAGFMNATWDVGETAFAVEFWAEVMRVLKPGGHVVAFSGTRTYHRLACAVEDAGFEIRDMVAWLYGCLSDDTEILTADGWKLGVDVRESETVAAWDAKTGAVVLAPVLEHTLAPYRGDLVRLVNDDTDQLLTPNHRVYHRAAERKMTAGVRSRAYPAAYSVAEAAQINRWNPVKLPCAGFHSGEGIGGLDYAALLGWVWTEGGFDKAPSSGVRVYQSETANPAKVAEIEALFERVKPDRKRYDRTRPYTHKGVTRDSSETCWFFSGELAQRVRADLPDKRPTWSLLWRMTQAEKLAFMDAAMKGDGCGDDFYQKRPEDLTWFQALLSVTGQRGKISLRKAPRDGGSVCITPRETTELQRRHLVNASQPYDGDVWCVRVSTGAFLARRNGKVFITGNSGFPKSHDVSKGIDKAAGAVREKVRVKPRPETSGTMAGSSDTRPWIEQSRINGFHEVDGNEPATDAARQWQGWGTALKPALEPIVLARKPLNGTVAANVQEFGTGAINVDGARVGDEGGTAKAAPVKESKTVSAFGNGLNGDGVKSIDAGRWPANLLHDNSPEATAGFPDKSSRYFYTPKADATERLGTKHPTVKPTDLMAYLIRLVTPPGGTTLDPFAGSGSTGVAAVFEGFNAVLIEREPEYHADILRRIAWAKGEGGLTMTQKRIPAAVSDDGNLFGQDAPPPNGEAGSPDLRRIRGRTIGPIGLKR